MENDMYLSITVRYGGITLNKKKQLVPNLFSFKDSHTHVLNAKLDSLGKWKFIAVVNGACRSSHILLP